MNRKRALTLVEISLTMTLASILLTTLYFLADHQRETFKRLKDNTVAIYMLESMRNFARYQLENGVSLAAVNGKELQRFVEADKDWKVLTRFSSENGRERIIISLARIRGKEPDCVYKTEVIAR